MEEERCTYLFSVFLVLTHSTSAKSLTRAQLLSVHITASPLPKVRDETHWQAQVIRLHTFGASKSHRHPVVIHQHMCWNASPSLNIVSDGIRLMHGCFSLVHAEGHCWLALQRHTHIHVNLDVMHIHYPLSCRRLAPSEEWKLSSSFFGPFAMPKNVENSNHDPLLLWQHLDNIVWG